MTIALSMRQHLDLDYANLSSAFRNIGVWGQLKSDGLPLATRRCVHGQITNYQDQVRYTWSRCGRWGRRSVSTHRSINLLLAISQSKSEVHILLNAQLSMHWLQKLLINSHLIIKNVYNWGHRIYKYKHYCMCLGVWNPTYMSTSRTSETRGICSLQVGKPTYNGTSSLTPRDIPCAASPADDASSKAQGSAD